jgi:hypothetical protein
LAVDPARRTVYIADPANGGESALRLPYLVVRLQPLASGIPGR